MKKNTASKTAEDMAGFRALETLRPRDNRVFEDAFARHFLTGAWASRCKSPFRIKLFLWLTHLMNPGAANTVSARARFIDEQIKACVKDGLEQLVILGAGFDCRACRMEELQKGITVFEVDVPATQERKKKVLAQVLEQMPEHLIFIPYELEEKEFGRRLMAKGYDRDKTTLYIMEGLIMYLAPDTVRNLFSFISEYSGPGSSVVFDFLPPGIEDGSIRNRAGKNMHRWAIRKGEPFKFSIDRASLPQFLSELGFYNVRAISAEQCREAYFTGKNRDRALSPLFSFAHAVVK